MSEADNTPRRRPPTIDLTAKEVETARPAPQPGDTDAPEGHAAPEAAAAPSKDGPGRVMPVALGALIGAALVGTFSGILLSYAVMAPIAIKIKSVRQKQLRLFTLVKQSLLAFMNGAMPQVAIEFGRKTIPSKERPTIDTVESEMIGAPAPASEPVKEAA